MLISGCNRRASLEKQFLEARAQFQHGYDNQAINSSQVGLARSGKYPEVNWNFRVLLAQISLRHEKPADALQFLNAEPISGISPQTAWLRSLALGLAYCKLHTDADADHLFAEAERDASGAQAKQAELAVYRGQCELSRRREAEAKTFFLQTTSASTADPFDKVEALLGLATCALRHGDNEKGVEFLLQGLELARTLRAGFFEQRALGRLGYAYTELGVFNKALESSLAAEKLASTLHQGEEQEKWQLDIGRAYQNMGKWGLARDYYQQALNSARPLNDLLVVARCLHNLSGIELYHGTIADAVRDHEEHGKLNLQGADLLDWNIDEAMIASRKGDPRAESLLLALLPAIQSVPRLTWVVEAELAFLYDRQGDAVRADKWFQRSIKTIDDTTARMNKVEFQIATRDSFPIIGAYVASLVAHNQPERSLQAGQLARARSLAEELGVKRPPKESAQAWVGRVQAMLRSKKEIALAYFNSEAGAYAWVVSPTHLQVKKLATQQDELETLTASYVKEIADHTDLASSSAQRKLYQLLVEPIRDFIPAGSHVILVGDSALYRINFETLVSDEGQPHYWIDDVEIENASSLDLLLSGQTLHRKGRGLLLVGAPEEVDPNYPRLPNAPLEMDNVQKHFPSAEVKAFSGKEADPEAYTEGNPGRFKFIHLATHGTSDTEDSMNSAVILSRGPHGAFQLYAKDIVKDELKLNADLVTISTCYGAGKGGAASEGLMGLQRAFLRAGAHQVIAALWNVDDATNPTIMDGLYDGIARHESASHALRAAKLKLVHSGDFHSAPYYWAPLQVYTGR